MAPRGLADTGALLAYLNHRDRWHDACVEALGRLPLPLATSVAVLAELFHLLADHPAARRTAWAFVRSGALTVLPVGDDDLPRLNELMERYADRPMDFADATLVLLAERVGLSDVFTVDHDDFETYRFAGRRRFRVHPARNP